MSQGKPRCEACKAPSEVLYMRNADGKFCCWGCVPQKEKAELAKAVKSGGR